LTIFFGGVASPGYGNLADTESARVENAIREGFDLESGGYMARHGMARAANRRENSLMDDPAMHNRLLRGCLTRLPGIRRAAVAVSKISIKSFALQMRTLL
jgi:hypothetical protein